jgi:hypothetical protein
MRKTMMWPLAIAAFSLGLQSHVQGSGNETAADADDPGLPKDQIEQIINAQGEVEHGTFHIELSRDDIGNVRGPMNVIFTPAFQISGDLFFQRLRNNQALLNGDLALKESEVNPFIAALLKNGLTFQAFHQHLPMHRQIWFVHFRGKGDPIALANEIKAALNVTSTPFPQAPPKNPTTPLNAALLGNILHGPASVGDDGVVTVWVYRSDPIFINNIHVNPQANISTNIEFKPLGGSTAAVVSDFAMTGPEVDRVVSKMLNGLNWYQGCLYNQETDEQPQLYFDHMLKTGDAYQLAREIRRGLDETDAK